LVASIVIYAWVSPKASIPALVPLEKAPAVLIDRAQQVLTEFGYTEAPADTEHSFLIPPDFPRWLAETGPTTNRWRRSLVARGLALLLWYPPSPHELEPDSPSPSVTPSDPALTLTDDSLVVLDTRGRLVEFRRVPPQRNRAAGTNDGASAQPDWDRVF